jgi:two-component system response regulator AtoC
VVGIGRDPDSDIVLLNEDVSRRHARLEFVAGSWMLSDLQSTRGTRVGGQSINSKSLALREAFSIGPYTLAVVPAGSSADSGVNGESRGTREASDQTGHGGHDGRPATDGHTSSDLLELLRFVESLFELTDLIGITDLQAILETLLERTMALLRAGKGFVVLVSGRTLSTVVTRPEDPAMSNQGISRTICQEIIQTRQPVLLSPIHDALPLQQIQSLQHVSQGMVLALPLIDGESLLGILYLEREQALPALRERPERLFTNISRVGGRALRVALERKQILSSSERWQWLAQNDQDPPDMFQTSLAPKMKEVMTLLERLAATDATALLLGESGTGKEVAARTIHALSARREAPFVAVNCGAIPRDLIESELFGYEKGAFTGALKSKPGRLELAQDGTLLLDEVGELPKDMQVKLLRVLETRTFEQLGSTRTIQWNARVIAATNIDLEEAVTRGEFREDLYYRLNVVKVTLPPLRSRREDIGALTTQLLIRANRRSRRRLHGATPTALALLQSYHWPGNIRELRNVIDRAFVIETGDRITPASLPFGFSDVETVSGPHADISDRTPLPRATLADFIRQQEIDYIQLVLDEVGGSVAQAAQILGMNRSALHRRMRQLGIGMTRGTKPEPDGADT